MVISIKSRGRENERTVIPQPRDTRVQSTTSPNLNIFLPYSNCLLRATKPYCEPCTSDTGFCFKCIVKKSDVLQLEINGGMQSNASDVTAQFLAELHVYTTMSRHRSITVFFGCLKNIGMVLVVYIGSLYSALREDCRVTKPFIHTLWRMSFNNTTLPHDRQHFFRRLLRELTMCVST